MQKKKLFKILSSTYLKIIKSNSENSIPNNYSIFYIYYSVKSFLIFTKKIVTIILNIIDIYRYIYIQCDRLCNHLLYVSIKHNCYLLFD